MKKILLFTLMCLVISVSADAKVIKRKTVKSTKTKTTKVISYDVENVRKVFVNDNLIHGGDVINDNSIVDIKDGGYLMFVDNTSKKRYCVTRVIKSKVKDLVTMVKKPKSISKAFLADMMLSRHKDEYSSAGNVERQTTMPIVLYQIETDENDEAKVYIIE